MMKEYLIQEKLGIGSYGTVYKVLKKDNKCIYVLKQISLFGLTPEEIKDVKQEAKILSSINSVYVVRYYDSFEEKNFLNIVMEYCDGGDLGKFIEEKKLKNEPINEDLIWILFIKITLGLAAIHKLKILHRDLKTLNIFLTKDLDVKIGDLGVAKILSHSGTFAKTLIGTPYYLSPELCEEKPYNDKSDIWALGCILYELCTFNHPFNAKSQGGLILKILEGEPDPIGNNYSSDLQNILYDLFQKSIDKRPSCKDLLKKNIIIEKSKKFGLFHMITELYPEIDNVNPIFHMNTKVNNNKLIYNKNRYPRNYKIKNSLQKNNSIGTIEISNNNINNRNINIYKKINKIKCKSQFNSISTESRSHNSIKNIFHRNNEKEPKDSKSNNQNNLNGGINIVKNNNININNKNNINKPFVKKQLNKFPVSAINKNNNNQNLINRRYINIEQYNNGLINKKSKAIKSINTSSKSAKKLLINLNNNNKVNLIKNGICLKSNKSTGKKFFIIPKTNSVMSPNNDINYKYSNNYRNSNDNIAMNNYYNKYLNNNLDINNNHNSNIGINNKEKNENINNNIKSKNQININESIEKFENKLKNYYQFSPEIEAKKIKYSNYNKIHLKTPNKENLISEDILLKLTPIDIIDTNNNNFMNIDEGEYNKNNNGKNNNLMEFVKNLNDYVPQYKISNQIPSNYKRNKIKSKSVCENEDLINYDNFQK